MPPLLALLHAAGPAGPVCRHGSGAGPDRGAAGFPGEQCHADAGAPAPLLHSALPLVQCAALLRRVRLGMVHLPCPAHQRSCARQVHSAAPASRSNRGIARSRAAQDFGKPGSLAAELGIPFCAMEATARYTAGQVCGWNVHCRPPAALAGAAWFCSLGGGADCAWVELAPAAAGWPWQRCPAGQARVQTNSSRPSAPFNTPLPQDGRTETLGGSKKLAAVAGNVQELRLLL